MPRKQQIWFDCEFIEDGQTIKLISIGLIREDGQTYYAELSDTWSEADLHDWLRENVLPLLGPPELRKPRLQVAAEITEFVGKEPIFWAYCGAYDWVAINQLFGTMMDHPNDWPYFCHDLAQVAQQYGYRRKLPKQTTPEHHALNDAVWTKEAHDWLMATVGGSFLYGRPGPDAEPGQV